ncbi:MULTISPECIES: type IVB secretion system protein IcmH/DotU [Burkholderia]|uniref:type IVB secretion system protein IcmH/DotU n=1 Tax=Burkholderia TaxID=32008 RepID=UPI000B7A48E3|nr:MULTISPECIES: type IVB secretion system protein IcmH/DotU [Burkholderia]MBY4724793.1 type IVB secretion system protein IcmH/DotU [Burkholderia contaminans]MCI3970037.1 type IVB secretion system protein IcmH/DotU [Burkholderia sp. HI4860]MDN7787542.1 type IVB secretion system protein IcmH/DotU [Burkholderia contaminans]OXI99200.1 type IV secretion protein DotU [Burkholderia sp. AU33647]
MSLSTADPLSRAGALASPSIATRLRVAEQSINPLLEGARILLSALADSPEMLDADSVIRRRRWLEHEIRLFTRMCGELGLRPEHVRSASYCLCSALDEAAMQTTWGKGEATGVEWQVNGLAAAMGHDRQGGDRVFQLIDEALRSPREHLDLIELYQNILDLGFRGRYRFGRDGSKRLKVIRERVHDVVVTGGLGMRDVSEPDRSMQRRVDPWVRPVVIRRSRVGAVVGLTIALLAGAAGYAAVDYWIRLKEVQRVSSFDLLARDLDQRLRDEVVAGNVELIRDPALNTLTLRFGGMFVPGGVTVAPWGASVVASAGREIATMADGATVRVAGYADSAPTSSARQVSNQALSEARARHVAQILVAAGVPVPSISVEGRGDADSLADNDTASGRARNRRVEVIVSN